MNRGVTFRVNASKQEKQIIFLVMKTQGKSAPRQFCCLIKVQFDPTISYNLHSLHEENHKISYFMTAFAGGH